MWRSLFRQPNQVWKFSSRPLTVRQFSSLPLQVFFASQVLPHPEKAAKGGEDAVFVEQSVFAFGVSDGVGGWAEAGVDPAEYARGLMREAAAASKVHLVKPSASADVLVRVLTQAWERTHALGSATALVGCIDPASRKLMVANLGDSGCVLLRRADNKTESQYEVAFQTNEQQHQFNCPYQLSSRETHRRYPNVLHDMPSMASTHELSVQSGDIVIAATDGVLDNVFREQMASLASRSCPANASPDACSAALAKALVTEAQRVGHSPTALSPFARNAMQHGFRFRGGKLDDASVVVACVV